MATLKRSEMRVIDDGLAMGGGYVWPAAGSVDTELRCLMELEVSNGETEVQPRVQA
jgi:hypothetical protein